MIMHETNNGLLDQAPLPRRLDLNLLVVFEAVWQERHVARAAARLALSQPATSHALARLRRIVGDPLFERAPGGVRPTLRAEAMWPAVDAALAHARTALSDGFDPTRLGRRLVLGMTANVAFTLLPHLVERVRAEAPDLDLAIRPIDRVSAPERLARGQVDAVVGLWEGELPASLARHALYRDLLVFVARPDHPIWGQADGPISPAVLSAWPHVLVTPSGEIAGPVDRLLARHGLTRRVALAVSDYRLALDALTTSDFVAVLGGDAAARAGDAIRRAVLAEPVPDVAIDLVASVSASPLAEWLADLMRAVR